MATLASHLHHVDIHPLHLTVTPAVDPRNRLTVFFRALLAIPHLILVGAPMAFTLSWATGAQGESATNSGAGGGLLGVVACLASIVAWVVIVVSGEHPATLRDYSAWYLRWRVRANAYVALLRDDYPPFGDEPYAVRLTIDEVPAERDRLSVALRFFLAIPHLIMMWALGVAWLFATIAAWFAILFTGRHPAELYRFGTAVLRFNTNVEAYLLLLHDELPPFTLRAD